LVVHKSGMRETSAYIISRTPAAITENTSCITVRLSGDRHDRNEARRLSFTAPTELLG
jgi:hypothetical protein